MTKYKPGSFTKNFGWNRHPPGLSALYVTIRSGFGGRAVSVSRDDFRAACGVAGTAQQLIPVNFFLHNTVMAQGNYVSVDELVRHAINNPHSRRFDRLALFALHLKRQGKRIGVAGEPAGAAFTNEFVRTRLWDGGGWRSDRLTDDEVERSFDKTIIAEGDDTVHKCMTNYVYILEMSGLKGQSTKFINTHIDEWIGPALFLAFDRYWLDQYATGTPTPDDLLRMVEDDELYKLMGVPHDYVWEVAKLFAAEYLELGGLHRVGAKSVVGPTGTPVTSPVLPPATKGRAGDAPVWSDEDAENAAVVIRRLQEVQAQIRNARHVREMKSLYEHACAFCGKQTIVGVGPDRHYSEAAHIKPVGAPHNGPDRKDNMLILCPEHHLQFDRGVLTLRKNGAAYEVRSKIPGDPLHKTPVCLIAPHEISEEFTVWHANFWK